MSRTLPPCLSNGTKAKHAYLRSAPWEIPRVSVVGGDDDGGYDEPAYGSMQRQASYGGSAAAGFSASRPQSSVTGPGAAGGGFEDEF